jgi:hypothetical protein
LKVKENFWPCWSWLLMNRAPVMNIGVASLSIWWGAESSFVQVTVVPAGTVIDAGTKAKFWMVTSTVPGVIGVVGAAVVVVTGAVVAVVVGTVVVGGCVVGAGVAGGAVVCTVVTWVVAGAGPEGDVQPAAMIAARRRISRIA